MEFKFFAGYLTYGDSLRDSIINSLQIKWIQQAVNVFITLHVMLTLTIVFNPLNQEAEEILGVPHGNSLDINLGKTRGNMHEKRNIWEVVKIFKII